MESTVCIFNMGKSECNGKRNTHIPHLICSKHLEDYFGLRIFHSYIETPLAYHYAPWCLAPVPGMFFKENDVILPVREFYDRVYRTPQVGFVDSLRKYKINPRTDEFMRQILTDGRLNKTERLIYEIIRNLSEEEEINVNPSVDCENDPKPIAYIRSKMAISNTFIEKHSILNYVNGLSITDDKLVETKLNSPSFKLSLAYRYFMSKFEYECHTVSNTSESKKELPRLVANAVFIKDVGLVAMTDISDPEPIVVHGIAQGCSIEKDYGYYDELVITQPKEIVSQKVAPYRISSQNFTRRAFISNCL
ncbi:hypothetical protein AVEN_261783-1 [Araneus ventricosus]|uniref:Uncharacterized protein n=1 Tax=Araneus ventricosus TaxID=182803 RepID=A0A4Y2LZW3_ARAVE|nr:hypothetical protein AVEN_261783-1 [Araneus ventricosus]